MSLTSGKMLQFTMVFSVPVGVSISAFQEQVNRGVSMSAHLTQFARGAVANVVDEVPTVPNLKV